MESGENGAAAINLAVEAALSNLKPLRDLAQNWDIDIASCLEDYLHELTILGHPPDPKYADGLPGNDGGGSAPPNFAQAALLLQNSSSVYSRKVEYLYSLVYQQLNELIASTRSGKNGKQAGKKGGTDAILEELNDYDPDMEFLLLDDVLPTDDSPDGDRINLVEDDLPIDLLLGDANESLVGATPQPNDTLRNATRLSLGGLSVTRLERSSLGGAIRGGGGGASSEAATRALIGTILSEGSDAGQGNLRLLSGKCDVSATGALLMPGSSLLGNSARVAKGTRDGSMVTNPNASLFGNEPLGAAGGDNMMDDDDDVGAANFDDGDDDDHGDGVGFALADNEDEEKKEEGEATGNVGSNPPKRVQFAPIPPKKDDPWALLDPHDATLSKGRPLRIGVTYRLPPGVDDTPSECVTGSRTKRRSLPMKEKKSRKRTVEGLDRFISVATFKSSMAAADRMNDTADETMVSAEDAEREEALAEIASVPMTGLAFGNEFAYIAKATAKREAAAKREERRKKLAEENASVPAGADQLDDFEDDDYGGGFDFGDDGSVDENDEGPAMGNVGMTSLDEAISGAAAAGEHVGCGEDSPNLDAETFEALCRAHLKAFARGAEKYASETQLSRRVGDWQSRLAPILEEEEQRPEFDIHVYGDRIIQGVKKEIEKQNDMAAEQKLTSTQEASPTNVVDFHTVTKTSDNYDVCRLFLSSLMLCNSGNVVLSHEHEGAAVASPETLRITLLDDDLERPMEKYLAPSAAEKENNMVVS